MQAYIVDDVTNNKIQNNVKLKYAITSMNNISSYNRNSYSSNVNISNDIILIITIFKTNISTKLAKARNISSAI